MDLFFSEHSEIITYLLSSLVALICFLLIQSYNKLSDVITAIRKEIKETQKEHKKDRETDHQTMAEIFRRLGEHGEEISEIRATCEATQKHCPVITGARN